MKKIYSLLLTVLLLAGCDKDLLDTSPYDSIGSSNMWTTDNLTDLGVNGVYAALNESTVAGREVYMMDVYSFIGQHRNAEPMLMATITPSDAMFRTNWQGLYEGVQRANDAILNLPKSPAAEEKKSRYMAECKFLRAYFYSRLNQLWKGVPLYLEPFSDAEATRPRSTEAQVWTQVITDLTEAINEPNLPARYDKGHVNYGHVTKGAAYALRGKAYLYTQQWALAAADFNKVKEAGYTLFADYRALFKEANEQSGEMIFSIQNLALAGYGSSTQWYSGSRSSFGSGFSRYLVSPNLVNLYENADGSPFNWNSVIPGYTALAPAKREVFFLRNNLTTAERNAAVNRGLDMSLYLPTGNEQRIKQAYVNRDPRLGYNVITPYSTYNGVFGSVNSTVTSRWPYRSDNLSVQDLNSEPANRFNYLHRKFVYEGNAELLTRDASPADMPIIRYADVLLMWAEALNEQSFSPEALALVNQVRARAGVATLQSANAALPTYVNSQAALRERIRDERRREFPNEGINYFDELRWKTYKDKVFASGNGARMVWEVNVQTYSYLGDHLYNWPIPQVEMERNPNLVQNPGWPN